MFEHGQNPGKRLRTIMRGVSGGAGNASCFLEGNIFKVMEQKFNRRRFLQLALAGAPLLAAGDAMVLEPEWLKTRMLRIGTAAPTHRLAHITDLHYKGDRAYLREIVEQVNALKPDFVCFTGDLVEKAAFLGGALEGLSGIQAPLYGCLLYTSRCV